MISLKRTLDMNKRPVYDLIYKRLQEPRRCFQVLIGPRQVGKTTLALQIAASLQKPYHFISADTATLKDTDWLAQEWQVARGMIDSKKGAVLIIDELQKVPDWWHMLKQCWDDDTRLEVNLMVMILGSSPWLIQKGLTESLAGRFEIIPITHWTFQEMQETFDFSLDQYLYYGGYPGAVPYLEEEDDMRWYSYMNDSLIETTISRDISVMATVNKPALLRHVFQVGCAYSGQILSYTKMLGQMQDSGNTTTLAHYLDLLSKVGFVAGLQKISKQQKLRNSSPKLCVYNTALMTLQDHKGFAEAKKDRVYWGRLVESAVGAYLLNAIRGTRIELLYWREGDAEVDYVLRLGDKITVIEVKSGDVQAKSSGMDQFCSEYKQAKKLYIGPRYMPLEQFLKTKVMDLL